jgi:hypothetical protein
MSKIVITPEMLEAARRKREQDTQLEQSLDIQDPGQQNICIGCE